MFWGLILEPNKRYTQIVDKAFHVSMASLDFNGKIDPNVVQVMVSYENRKYIICNLVAERVFQQPLDLTFEPGTKVTFVTNGNSSVHLTGYHIADSGMCLDAEDFMRSLGGPENSKKRKKCSGDRDHSQPIKKSKTEEDFEVEEDLEDEDLEEEEEFLGEEEEQDYESTESSDSLSLDSDEEEEGEEEEEEEEENHDSDDYEETLVVNDKKKKEGKQQTKSREGKDKKKNKENVKQMNGGNASPIKKTKGSPTKVMEGGVKYEDITVGKGKPVKKGSIVNIFYTGRLKDGTKLDSVTRGKGITFEVGSGQVIKGLELGVCGMRRGGKRTMNIPSNLLQGQLPEIPKKCPLVMLEVEVRRVA